MIDAAGPDRSTDARGRSESRRRLLRGLVVAGCGLLLLGSAYRASFAGGKSRGDEDDVCDEHKKGGGPKPRYRKPSSGPGKCPYCNDEWWKQYHGDHGQPPPLELPGVPGSHGLPTPRGTSGVPGLPDVPGARDLPGLPRR